MTTWKIGENNGQTNETHGQIEKNHHGIEGKNKSQKPKTTLQTHKNKYFPREKTF